MSLAIIEGAAIAVNYLPGVEVQVHGPDSLAPSWVGMVDSGATAIAGWHGGFVAAQATADGVRIRSRSDSVHGIMDDVLRAPYRRVPRARSMFGMLLLATDRSAVHLVSSIADSLFTIPASFAKATATSIPSVRRWGDPPSPEFAIREADSLGRWGEYSRLEDLSVVDEARVAVIYQDLRTTDEITEGNAYLSIIDHVTGVGCVDIPIPGNVRPRRRFSVLTDTLVVVAQIQSARQLVVERFVIGAAACEWLPTKANE